METCGNVFWDSLTHLCIFMASRTQTAASANDSTQHEVDPEENRFLNNDEKPIDEISRRSYLHIPTAPMPIVRLQGHDP